jgi:hypothetical protein
VELAERLAIPRHIISDDKGMSGTL